MASCKGSRTSRLALGTAASRALAPANHFRTLTAALAADASLHELQAAYSGFRLTRAFTNLAERGPSTLSCFFRFFFFRIQLIDYRVFDKINIVVDKNEQLDRHKNEGNSSLVLVSTFCTLL